jgi:hypothetical protein
VEILTGMASNGEAAPGAFLQDYALVVGINHYEFEDLANLEGAENDATDFINWLQHPCSYGELLGERIMSRLAQARFSDLQVLVTRLLNHVGKRGRRLYVFLAGHGCGENLTSACLYSSEHTERNQACWDIAYDVGRLGLLFEEIILFADCCRTSSAGAEPYRMRFVVEGRQQPDLAFYCLACEYNGVAEEDVLGDGRFHGVFSHFLLEALHGHVKTAINANGEVTAHSLTNYLVRTAGLKPTFLPTHENDLRKIVLARGFTPPLRTIEVRQKDPLRGFAVFNAKYEPLQIERRLRPDGGIEFTTTETDNLVVAVPAVADLDDAETVTLVRARETSVEI